MEEAGEGRVAAYGGGGDGVGCAYSTKGGEIIERCRVGAATFLKGAGKKEEGRSARMEKSVCGENVNRMSEENERVGLAVGM